MRSMPLGIFSRSGRGVPHRTRFARDVAAFRVAELRVDRREVLVDHVLDADARGALLARLGEEDHVAIERDVARLSISITIRAAVTLSLSSTVPRP